MSRFSSLAEIIGSYFGLRSSHRAKRDFTLGLVLKSVTQESTRGLSMLRRSQPAGGVDLATSRARMASTALICGRSGCTYSRV